MAKAPPKLLLVSHEENEGTRIVSHKTEMEQAKKDATAMAHRGPHVSYAVYQLVGYAKPNLKVKWIKG
jgi:hypothetical protein